MQFQNPEGGKAIDVRRLLLNKCQEEFESGTQVSASMHMFMAAREMCCVGCGCLVIQTHTHTHTQAMENVAQREAQGDGQADKQEGEGKEEEKEEVRVYCPEVPSSRRAHLK